MRSVLHTISIRSIGKENTNVEIENEHIEFLRYYNKNTAFYTNSMTISKKFLSKEKLFIKMILKMCWC